MATLCDMRGTTCGARMKCKTFNRSVVRPPGRLLEMRFGFCVYFGLERWLPVAGTGSTSNQYGFQFYAHNANFEAKLCH